MFPCTCSSMSRGGVHPRRAAQARGSRTTVRQLAGVRPNLPRVSLRRSQPLLPLCEGFRLSEDRSHILVLQSLRHAGVEGGLCSVPAAAVWLLSEGFVVLLENVNCTEFFFLSLWWVDSRLHPHPRAHHESAAGAALYDHIWPDRRGALLGGAEGDAIKEYHTYIDYVIAPTDAFIRCSRCKRLGRPFGQLSLAWAPWKPTEPSTSWFRCPKRSSSALVQIDAIVFDQVCASNALPAAFTLTVQSNRLYLCRCPRMRPCRFWQMSSRFFSCPARPSGLPAIFAYHTGGPTHMYMY